MLAKQSATTVPPHIITCINRATDRAVKVLRRDHRMAAHRRVLRPQGEAWVRHEAAQASAHPTAPHALELLETVLCDVMVESALKAQAAA